MKTSKQLPIMKCNNFHNIFELSKIGKLFIVTWIGVGNYGTSLQSYALCKYLETKGFDVYFLKEFVRQDYPLKKLKIFLYKIGLWKLIERRRKKPRTEKERKLQKFNNEYYSIKEVFTQEEYKELLDNKNVFITGSDQIWNAFHYFNSFYFLDFAANCKRIAYASSTGVPRIPAEYSSQIEDLLSRFSHIGLRESSSVPVIKSLVGGKVDVRSVLDPTFLLNRQQWEEFAEGADLGFTLPEKYILVYFVGNNPEYVTLLESVKLKLDIETVIMVAADEKPTVLYPDAFFYEDCGPLEFVHLIQHASFVCSDSFHASAISFNMNKQFGVFLRFSDSDMKSQNSRIYDFTSTFGLEDAIYREKNQELYQINYESHMGQLEELRQDSINFLLNSIVR